MAFNSKNPLISPVVENVPSAPMANTRGIYPKNDGWYDIDSSGNGDKFVSLNELERLQYYGDKDIIPSPESYFTVNSTGETITGLTDAGKTQAELVIPYKINGVLITNLYSGADGTSILDGATDKITKIILPNTITEIIFAFYCCPSLSSINIPDSVTSIGESTFDGCTSLTSINIPNSVASIGYNAFFACPSLSSINIPDSVTSIGDYAFDDCRSLKSINIPSSVTSIGVRAFMSCTSLISVDISDGVTSIGAFTFLNCTSLKTISIPSSVTSIADNAFNGCSNFTIYCEQGSYAETYAKTNNIPVIYTDVKDIATEAEIERLKYYGDKDIVPSPENYFTVNSTGETITGLTDEGKIQTELVIPYKINNILITTLDSGYSGTSILHPAGNVQTKVVIPNSVTNIGGYAFFNCSTLTSVNIPNSVTDIDYYAFCACTSLKTMSIPNSVKAIYDYAFNACSSLKIINLPNSVTSIGEGVFGGCTNLTIYCEQGSTVDTYAKSNKISVVYTAVNDIGAGVEIVDNLITSDSTKALSANQGKILNDNKVDKVGNIAIGPDPDVHVLGLHIESNMIYENTEDRFKLSKDGLEINYFASGYAPNTADVIVNRNVESAEGTYSVVTHKLSEKANTSDVLTKTNTTEYTPTANYHPATKKYVDDSISTSGGGDMLKTVYDTNNTGVVDNAEKLGGQLPSYYAKASTLVVVTLPNTVADWTINTDDNGETYYIKSFSNETFTSDGTPFVGVNYSDTISIARQQAEAYDSIDRVKVTDGTAIFYCFNDIPSVSLDIQIKMVY